jgi:hypothetical protein
MNNVIEDETPVPLSKEELAYLHRSSNQTIAAFIIVITVVLVILSLAL